MNTVNRMDLLSYYQQLENWTKYVRQHWVTGRIGLWSLQEGSPVIALALCLEATSEPQSKKGNPNKGICRQTTADSLSWGERCKFRVSVGQLKFVGPSTTGESDVKVELQESAWGSVSLTVCCYNKLHMNRVNLHKARKITMNRESTTTDNL